ncbi:uncharacterized protein MEPE_02406 [Melanopsichium pennsylvanicum]|uniref:Uncharacterized protein n=1 Tax=Melanopsichium pennsylvanicum TaxID=63383 RepID=A0AAJ5C4N6_9BASI|nr:uncharacterized protein MEPE_02406 [Melanopsichium pennsylvanicum]
MQETQRQKSYASMTERHRANEQNILRIALLWWGRDFGDRDASFWQCDLPPQWRQKQDLERSDEANVARCALIVRAKTEEGSYELRFERRNLVWRNEIASVGKKGENPLAWDVLDSDGEVIRRVSRFLCHGTWCRC